MNEGPEMQQCEERSENYLPRVRKAKYEEIQKDTGQSDNLSCLRRCSCGHRPLDLYENC